MSNATRHTAIINDPIGMWSKLAWDADAFRDIQISYPDESQPLAYAAINVCIAATSLRDWTMKSLERAAKDKGVIWDEKAYKHAINAAIPEMVACVAIANTAKHSDFRERDWTDGEVQLVWEEGSEDVPPGFVLYHVVAGSHNAGFAVSRFSALCRNWWEFLTAHGLTAGHTEMAEWHTNKLNRIFRPFLQAAGASEAGSDDSGATPPTA